MKRLSGLYEKVYDIHNLELADERAKKGKKDQPGVIKHNKSVNENLWELQKMLMDKTYRTSKYKSFSVFEPKERLVYSLPYFPDRIAQWAIMNVLESIWIPSFTTDTYSCIKGRGIHGAFRALKSVLRNQKGTKYCLKLDIKKYYPSVDHDVLKSVIRRKIKDKDLLWLLDEIIDSAPGLPIGNLLSQYLANLFLTPFDHWLKEHLKVKYYFRYCDDLVFLSDNKPYLHRLLAIIRDYLSENLKLEIKSNYQIFPVESRGIDFCGYVFFHTHIRLRKSIKQNFARMLAKRPNPKSIASYHGWTSHANCRHLFKKLIHVAATKSLQRLGHYTYFKELPRPEYSNGGYSGSGN